MDSVSLTFWQSNPMIFAVYAALVIGFLAGLFTFSKFLTYVFGRARHTAYSLIVGLSLGSIVAMFYNPDTFAVYASWAENGVKVTDIVLGVVLFAIGAVGSYLLVRYQRKKDAEAAAAAAEKTIEPENGNENSAAVSETEGSSEASETDSSEKK